MLRSPAFRALVGFGGTLCALGGATLAVSTATSAVIRVAVKTRQAKRMVPCRACCRCSDATNSSTSSSSSSSLQKPGTRRCAVCRGRRAVRWQPFAAPIQARWTLCPLCKGSGQQLCWNCAGSGEVVGSDAEVEELRKAKGARGAAAAEATTATAIAIR